MLGFGERRAWRCSRCQLAMCGTCCVFGCGRFEEKKGNLLLLLVVVMVVVVVNQSLHSPPPFHTPSFPGTPRERRVQPAHGGDHPLVHTAFTPSPCSPLPSITPPHSCRDRPVSDACNLLMAASVAEQVAWALDFLHASCGMLHLDVKGANVLVRLGAGGGPGDVVAKLADFGLTVKRVRMRVVT
eukprot:150729-Chlamydomonas_euryale.AAC.1